MKKCNCLCFQIDIDECGGGLGPCSLEGSTRCLNYNGSYECRCNSDDLGQTWCGKHCHKENPCRLVSKP